MNRATTMRTGITVQASSTWLLPYTWGGSRPSSFFRSRNLTTEWSNKVKTTKKMAPVTASTNRDSPKIDFAGVEAGAKMFVGLSGGDGAAKAVAEQPTQRRICERRQCHRFEPRDCN